VSTFVLVHGGWHGAWCWRRVVPLLRANGHEVLTPTLTGLGERAHLVAPEVDLSTHIRDLAAVLEYEDVRDAVLVGHSYSGVVISGVAEVASERVAQLVYLDAFVPEEGRTTFDLLPAERVAVFEQAARENGDGWLVPLPWEGALAGWGVTDPEDLRWMVPRMTPQPLATFVQPAGSTAAAQRLPRTYAHCTEKPAADAFAPFAAAAARDGSGWRYMTLRAGHNAMVTAPEAVARVLMELLR
jgi:pimeloyl-ACP methyl ester carboxylesterase